MAYLELTPFSFFEVDEMELLWLRGGFPRSYLAETLQDSYIWREFYITTFLERDIPALGMKISKNDKSRHQKFMLETAAYFIPYWISPTNLLC